MHSVLVGDKSANKKNKAEKRDRVRWRPGLQFSVGQPGKTPLRRRREGAGRVWAEHEQSYLAAASVCTQLFLL